MTKTKIDWIECNLPWETERVNSYHLFEKYIKEHKKEIAKLDKKIEQKCFEKFGYRGQKETNELFNKLDLPLDITSALINAYNFFFRREDEKKYSLEKLTWKDVKNTIKKETYFAGDRKEAISKIEKLWKEYFAMMKVHREMRIFEEACEESVEIDKIYEAAKEYEDANKEKPEPSFCNSGLNKAGTLIQVTESMTSDSIKEYLIGDFGTGLSQCDCCRAFEKNVIVTKYKIVWQK